MSERCAKCGEFAVVERLGTFEVEHGGKREPIQDRHMHCSACGNIGYRGEQISAHELAVAAKVREMGGLLSAEELRRVRGKYGFTQREMEDLLGTGPKTWVRWERGKVPQSKVADTLIRQIAADPWLVRNLMEQAGISNPEALAILDRFDAEERRLARRMLKERFGAVAGVDMDEMADRAVDVVHVAQRRVAAEAA